MYKTLLNAYRENYFCVDRDTNGICPIYGLSEKPPYFGADNVKNKLTTTNSCDKLFSIERRCKKHEKGGKKRY